MVMSAARVVFSSVPVQVLLVQMPSRFKAHSWIHRLSEPWRHRPAGQQFWLGAGGHAGPHLPPVTMQQVEQGRGILLSCKTEPLWRQGVCDGGQPRTLPCPGSEGVPGAGGVVCRAEAKEVSRYWGGLWLFIGLSCTALTGADGGLQFNSFPDFLYFCCRCLGLAGFAESSTEVSVHHAVDVPLEVSQDDTLRKLLHLNSSWTIWSFLHGSAVTDLLIDQRGPGSATSH